MLRMTPVICLHSQFLWGTLWIFAAGASTAGFLEKAAADLERELRTFKYPAMFFFSGPDHFAVQTRWNSEQRGGKASLCSGQYSERLSTAPPFFPSPAGDAGRYVRGTRTQRRDRHEVAVKRLQTDPKSRHQTPGESPGRGQPWAAPAMVIPR